MEALQEGLLKLDPGLLLWTVITFLAMALILWKAAWKPIVGALDSRTERIKGDIEKAERSRVEAEKILKDYNEMIANAREETAKIISDGRASAEKIHSEIIARANQEAEEITERSKKEIIFARDKALTELKLEVVNIATDIASKIIAKNLNPEDQEAIVRDTLDKFDSIQ